MPLRTAPHQAIPGEGWVKCSVPPEDVLPAVGDNPYTWSDSGHHYTYKFFEEKSSASDSISFACPWSCSVIAYSTRPRIHPSESSAHTPSRYSFPASRRFWIGSSVLKAFSLSPFNDVSNDQFSFSLDQILRRIETARIHNALLDLRSPANRIFSFRSPPEAGSGCHALRSRRAHPSVRTRVPSPPFSHRRMSTGNLLFHRRVLRDSVLFFLPYWVYKIYHCRRYKNKQQDHDFLSGLHLTVSSLCLSVTACRPEFSIP